MITFVLFCVLASTKGQSIQVTTVEGTIEGYEATDGGYYAFHGIPYAMPRTGLDMFKPSGRSSDLLGYFYANASDIECARPSPNGMIGDIDCLVLNVFTSNLTTSKPVLVWLNGEESNTTVSRHYSFKRLIDEKLVVVTLNYRLSVFGFLCLRTKEHPGNAGLKDIILGLEWVKRNIAVFGGDPNNVVLMGHGSAAAMADLITLNQAPKQSTHSHYDLVHKAIILSGSAMSPWAVSYDPIGAALTLNRIIGGPWQSLDDIAESLSSKSLNEINNALNQFKYTNNTQMFAPCIENTNLEGFLLETSPYRLLTQTGSYKHIPYIAGYVSREGTQRSEEAERDGWLEKMQTSVIDFLPVDLDFGSNAEKMRQAENIRHYYFRFDSLYDYFNYHGDTMTTGPIIRGLQMRVKYSTSDLWLLEFNYIGTKNTDWDFTQAPLIGAKHGDFLNYIFDFDLLTQNDGNVAKSIVKRLSSFAYTGIPTPPTNDTDGFPDWTPFSNDSLSYLSYYGFYDLMNFIQNNNTNPQPITRLIWDPLYNTYYNAPSSAVAGTKLSLILFSSVLLTIV